MSLSAPPALPDNSTFEDDPESNEPIDLLVNGAETSVHLTITERMSCAEIKQSLEEITGIKPTNQRLSYDNPLTKKREVFPNEASFSSVHFDSSEAEATKTFLELHLSVRDPDGKFPDDPKMTPVQIA